MELKQSFLIGTTGLCLLGLVTACGTSASKTTASPPGGGQPQKGGTITVALSSEPDTLDAQKTGSGYSWDILHQIGTALVFENPQTHQIEPYLATSWQMSKDGLTWTFQLRHGVTFSNGTPLTAEAFVKTYERAMNPKTSGGVATGNMSDVQSVSASSKYTLVFKLKQPFAPFLTDLADPGYMQPLDLSVVSTEGSNYGRKPVGSGPWKFVSWTSGQSITLTRNPSYDWAPKFFNNGGSVYPKTLVFKFISQEQTTVAALKTGQVDIAQVAPNDVSQFENNPNFHVLPYPSLGEDMVLSFNLDNPALKNLQVRQAINEAIDKQAIIKGAESGQATAVYGPLPPSFPDADPNVASYGYHYNLSGAAKLLQKAGYSKGNSGVLTKNGAPLTLNLNVMSGQSFALAAQLIQAQLNQVGIQVKIHSMDAATFMQQGAKGQYDMLLFPWGYNDPDILYLLFDSSQIGALNFDRLNDPTMDKLLTQARETMNPQKRKQLYFEIQKKIVKEAYWDPILVAKNYFVISSRVHGVKLDAQDGLSFHDAWVSQ